MRCLGAVGNEAGIGPVADHVRSGGMTLNVEVEPTSPCCKQDGNMCCTHSPIIIFLGRPDVKLKDASLSRCTMSRM